MFFTTRDLTYVDLLCDLGNPVFTVFRILNDNDKLWRADFLHFTTGTLSKSVVAPTEDITRVANYGCVIGSYIDINHTTS
jgi:hypothetical protein